MDQVVAKLSIGKTEPIPLICRSGKRSANACDRLAAHGYERLCNVCGGMIAWQAGLSPIQRNEKLRIAGAIRKSEGEGFA